MADRHADARRVARELSSHFGNPLDFTLRLFLTGSKNIVIPDHVFLHKGKVKGLLRYTISTGGLFFDPQWPAIDVSQTAESLFSQKAVDVDMHLNQTIARHFASRLGPAMVFLPLLQNQHHSGGGSNNNNNIDHNSSLVDHNPDVEHIITARYFSKESLFDVVGDLRASKASGILLEYRTPLDGYHNLLRATFTPFLLVMEMRKSNHSLKEHRVPLKLKVSTSAQKGGSNLAKEVQVPPSASALACDILNALVTKKEEGGEFVERCVAYFTVISPRQVLFLWCTQMNVMLMEHANQLSEQVTCLNDNNHNNKDGTSENNNNTTSQSKASKSLQEKDQKNSPSSKKKTISASATVATASSYNQHHPNKDGNDDHNNKDGQNNNNNNNNNNNVTSTNSSLNKKGKVVNNINSVNAIKVHPDATTDQSFLSRQLLHDLKLIGHKKNSDESQPQQQVNTTAGEATDVGMLSEINNNNNDEEYELNATQEENVVWEDGHSEENYIREHSTIMQHLPSGYSAMRDEKKFVSSLQRVRENYDSPLNKKNNASRQEPGENEDPQAVRNLATVAAARKVARMFGIAKQELPSRPKELDRYSKSNRSLEDYSASRTQHARKQTVSKRKQELDKLALALNRAKQRREEEQLRQTFYGNTANVKRSKKTIKKAKVDPFGATVTSATGDEEDVNTHEEVEAQAAAGDDEEEEEEDQEEEDVPPPAAIILPELPSAARDVTLLSDAEFDDYLAEIQDQTYERFDCGMSGYVIDMPAHFIFSKYGKPRFNYGDSGGGHGNASGGGGKNNNGNNNAGSSAPAATLLDQLLHPGSLRDLKRKERHTRNAPPLIDVGAGKSYIEQTVSSKVGQDLLSSKLLGVNHQTRRKQLLEQEQQRNNTKNNNNNNNNKRTGSPTNASNKKTDKNVKKKSSSNNNNNNVTSRSRSVSELMFNQLNNNHDNTDQSSQHQHHLRKTHQSQYSNSETAQTPNSNDLENQISIMNRFANENYRQQRKFSPSVSPSRNQKLLSHSVSKRSLLTTGSSSTPQQQHLMSSYGSTSKKNHNDNESNAGDGVSSLEVMAYLNSTSATRMNRRKRENHRRSPSNDESHQKHQQGIYREHDDDDDDDEEYNDDSSNESSNASEELMLQTTAEPSNQTTGVIKTTGYSQQDASRLTYTVHKIRNLGQAIFQTAADLLYRACSHQAARRSVVEIVIPFGYRHLDQELRSTFLTLGLEEQPIELMGRINEFREQHENDGTSYGELALNTPIGDVQSMFDDESFVRQSNGQIASLRDEWYSLEGGGSVEFVLRQAQTAVPRAEKLLQTLEAELNPLARFDTPLCTPNDVKCCERLCELVDVRGFTICDAANVLVNERKQKQDQMMFMSIQQQQQQQQGRKR